MRVLVARLSFLVILAGSAPGQSPQPDTSSRIRKEFVLGKGVVQNLAARDGSLSDPAIVGYVQAIEDRLDLFLVFRRPLGGVARAILPAACFQQALVGNEEADECRLPAKIAPHKDGLRKS
jgi:hypothetical protein